jgi:hypothetical protein
MVDDGDVAGEELNVARLSVGDGIAKHGTLMGEMEATNSSCGRSIGRSGAFRLKGGLGI